MKYPSILFRLCHRYTWKRLLNAQQKKYHYRNKVASTASYQNKRDGVKWCITNDLGIPLEIRPKRGVNFRILGFRSILPFAQTVYQMIIWPNLGFLQCNSCGIVSNQCSITIQSLLPLHGREECRCCTCCSYSGYRIYPKCTGISAALAGWVVVVTPHLGLRRIVIHLI